MFEVNVELKPETHIDTVYYNLSSQSFIVTFNVLPKRVNINFSDISQVFNRPNQKELWSIENPLLFWSSQTAET